MMYLSIPLALLHEPYTTVTFSFERGHWSVLSNSEANSQLPAPFSDPKVQNRA